MNNKQPSPKQLFQIFLLKITTNLPPKNYHKQPNTCLVPFGSVTWGVTGRRNSHFVTLGGSF